MTSFMHPIRPLEKYASDVVLANGSSIHIQASPHALHGKKDEAVFISETFRLEDWTPHLVGVLDLPRGQKPTEDFVHQNIEFRQKKTDKKPFAQLRVDWYMGHPRACEVVSIAALPSLSGRDIMTTVCEYIDLLPGNPQTLLLDDAHRVVANPAKPSEKSKLRILYARAFSALYPESTFALSSPIPNTADPLPKTKRCKLNVEDEASWYSAWHWRPIHWASDWKGSDKRLYFVMRQGESIHDEIRQYPGEFNAALPTLAEFPIERLTSLIENIEIPKTKTRIFNTLQNAQQYVPDALQPRCITLGRLIAFHVHQGRKDPTSLFHVAKLMETFVDHEGVSDWVLQPGLIANKDAKHLMQNSKVMDKFRIFVRDRQAF